MGQLFKAALPLPVEDPCEENQLMGCAQSPPEQFCAMSCLLVSFSVGCKQWIDCASSPPVQSFYPPLPEVAPLVTKYQTL